MPCLLLFGGTDTFLLRGGWVLGLGLGVLLALTATAFMRRRGRHAPGGAELQAVLLLAWLWLVAYAVRPSWMVATVATPILALLVWGERQVWKRRDESIDTTDYNADTPIDRIEPGTAEPIHTPRPKRRT